MQTTPRFLKSGESNRVVSSGSSFLTGLVLTSKTGAASLSLWHRGAGSVNVTLDNRLFVRAGGISSPATITIMSETLWLSGITASLSGGGARATLFIADRTRGQ